MKRKLQSYLDFRNVLEEVGFNVLTPTDVNAAKESEAECNIDFDFTVVDKDTLIKFFADTEVKEINRIINNLDNKIA